ncbi:MAG: tripartite tricarboxylate transporter substrate binding protein [Hyphomicrobiales bacterium]|nr:tripartite tricarboxylate transporter substrate binding protein [Hyphomicrobiales bacterium]
MSYPTFRRIRLCYPRLAPVHGCLNNGRYRATRGETRADMETQVRAQIKFSAIAAAAMLLLAMRVAVAQDYPTRTITIIVPFTAGGPNDVAARIYADGLRRHFTSSATIVIENRAGGSGIPGTEAALQAEPDGHTLLMGGIAPLTLIPPIQKVRYNTEKDFAPLGLMWRSPQAFAVHPRLGVRSVSEFVARAKANPGKLTIGSAGLGTVTHLANELLRREAGIEFTHVPYKSTANSLNDLLGGHIDAIFGDTALVKPQAEAGKLTALATTGAYRSPLMPDLMTTAEAGLPAVQTEVWYGALVSARTPAPIIARLQAATLAVQKDAAVQTILRQHGVELGETGAQAFATFIRREIERWKPIVTTIKTK